MSNYNYYRSELAEILCCCDDDDDDADMGGDLGGLGGRLPQNLRWGDGPYIRPPNILRNRVCRMPAKPRTE